MTLQEEIAQQAFNIIKHGDDEHQKWLLEKCNVLAQAAIDVVERRLLSDELAINKTIRFSGMSVGEFVWQAVKDSSHD